VHACLRVALHQFDHARYLVRHAAGDVHAPGAAQRFAQGGEIGRCDARDHDTVGAQHAGHLAQQQDVGRAQFIGQVEEDILGGDDSAAAHVVQRDVAVDQRYEPLCQRSMNWVRVQILQRAVVAVGRGGWLHAQHRDAGLEEGVGDDAIEAGGGSGYLGVAAPLGACVYPLPCAIGPGGPVAEGARPVADEEGQIGDCVEGLAHFARQPGQIIVPGGVGVHLVGDEGAAEFHKYNNGMRNKRINGMRHGRVRFI